VTISDPNFQIQLSLNAGGATAQFITWFQLHTSRLGRGNENWGSNLSQDRLTKIIDYRFIRCHRTRSRMKRCKNVWEFTVWHVPNCTWGKKNKPSSVEELVNNESICGYRQRSLPRVVVHWFPPHLARSVVRVREQTIGWRICFFLASNAASEQCSPKTGSYEKIRIVLDLTLSRPTAPERKCANAAAWKIQWRTC
jgi:hypothetical protein